jgi:hypothetical protein
MILLYDAQNPSVSLFFVGPRSRLDWLGLTHDHPDSGHRGACFTLMILDRCVKWENMANEVKEYFQALRFV